LSSPSVASSSPHSPSPASPSPSPPASPPPSPPALPGYECRICREESSRFRVPSCGHILCLTCIDYLFENKPSHLPYPECPFCKRPLYGNEYPIFF
jgi:hypothetical protein